MTIVHVLPKNTSVCGGIKVHYQLSEIEKSLGMDSYVAFPDEAPTPTWFAHKCNVIDYKNARELLKNPGSVVVGWEDVSVLRSFAASKRVCYIQGEVFVNRSESFVGIDVWYSSKWNMTKVGKLGHIVSPFINTDVFHPGEERERNNLIVLVQKRKFGVEKWGEVKQYFSPEVRSQVTEQVLEDVNEEEFAKVLRNVDVFFAHSYPEGFGLPALEAMASKSLVIGYSGGGGTDFMKNGINCLMSADGDASGVFSSLFKYVYSMGNSRRKDMLTSGLSTARSYNIQRTTDELKNALL